MLRVPEEGSHQAALRCGDWLAEITPLGADVEPAHGGVWVRCTSVQEMVGF